MFFLAEDLREIMAELGFRTIDEMVGHTEVLVPRFIAKGKAKSLDFARILGTTLPIARKVTDPFWRNDNGQNWIVLPKQQLKNNILLLSVNRSTIFNVLLVPA